jgi:hypothetical protein
MGRVQRRAVVHAIDQFGDSGKSLAWMQSEDAAAWPERYGVKIPRAAELTFGPSSQGRGRHGPSIDILTEPFII